MKNYKDFFILLLLLFISAGVIYFSPKLISSSLAILLLVAAWRSKKDYFWLAFFMIIEDYPGGLFAGGAADADFRIPIYTFFKGVSFTVTEIYFLLMVLKAKKIEKRHAGSLAPFFNEWLKVLGVLLIVLIIISPILGMGLDSIRYTFKTLVQFTLFYSIFRLIPGKEEFISFLKVLLPFTIMAVTFQVYSLITRKQIAQLFNPSAELTQGVLNLTTEFQNTDRPIELVSILFICFTGIFFLLYYKKHNISQNLLIIYSFLCTTSIVMTATRSWILGFLSGLIAYLIITRENFLKMFRYGFIFLIFAIIIEVFVPVVFIQIENAWNRVETVELLIKGDITAGGTLLRFDVRAPVLIKAFNESTIILGAGFSDLHLNKNDYHLGYLNLLFNSGIIGVIIFALFFLKLFATGFNASQNKYNIYPKIILIGLISLFILLIINTGTQMIGFNTGILSRNYLQAYVLLLINISYQIYQESYTRKNMMLTEHFSK